MKVIEKIRKYITDGIKSGRFSPGDKIESYWELTKRFGGCYATIHSAMNKLAKEGLIRIEHGNGTFIAGDDTLKITFICAQEIFNFKAFGELLKKHTANKNLNLQVDFIHERDGMLQDFSDRTVIRFGNSGMQTNSVSNFIPCQYTSFEMGINGRLMKKLGLETTFFNSKFDCWSDLLKLCMQHNVTPASLNYTPAGKEHIQYFYGYLLSFFNGSTDIFKNSEPMFQTDAGRKILEIFDSLNIYMPSTEHDVKGSFYSNDALMNLCIGSWIFAQNKDPNRTDIHIDDLKTVPYHTADKRVMPVDIFGLRINIPSEASEEKRRRVKKFTDILLDRDFQLDWCNISGFISLNKDIKPEEYTWNTNEYSQSFFTREGDLTIEVANLIPFVAKASLSTILDFYKKRIINADEALVFMDIKKNLEAKKGTYLDSSYSIQL